MKVINKFDQGDSIILETTIETEAPFSDSVSKFDPDSVEITIFNPDGSERVNAIGMTKNDVGEYYYEWNTEQSYTEGDYEVEIVARAREKQEVIDDKYIRLR